MGIGYYSESKAFGLVADAVGKYFKKGQTRLFFTISFAPLLVETVISHNNHEIVKSCG
jgi:hypothetical protein